MTDQDWISEQTKEVLSKALGREYHKQEEPHELARLKEIEKELVSITEQWAEARPGPERAQLAARIAMLKKQLISQRIACKRSGLLKEV